MDSWCGSILKLRLSLTPDDKAIWQNKVKTHTVLWTEFCHISMKSEVNPLSLHFLSLWMFLQLFVLPFNRASCHVTVG